MSRYTCVITSTPSPAATWARSTPHHPPLRTAYGQDSRSPPAGSRSGPTKASAEISAITSATFSRAIRNGLQSPAILLQLPSQLCQFDRVVGV
ncbi:hypothetical protein [Streptomyces violaceusniger]|uniref:hypothetical protein n=1 Tax=Streptomyces violaceusniger TaxID=68280 RepID=UPI0010F861A2